MSRSARVACTIIAGNYAPQATVLATSFLHHHPGCRFVTLLIDEAGGAPRSCAIPGEVITLADVDTDPQTLARMAAVYDVTEFATAVKASLLRTLLPTSDAVLYLDPDMLVLGPLTDAFDAAEQHGIVLIPHVLAAMPRDGQEPGEDRIRHSGIFNLGFAGVGAGGAAFLDWWAERLEHDAHVDLGNALFTDQRWVDWVPALWQPHVLRDPGLNVAYWNLHERPLDDSAGTLTAGGSPARLLHFSGYDPSRPWQLSKHAAIRPRVRITDEPALQRVCDAYGAALRAHGWPVDAPQYRWNRTADGVVLTPLVRSALRRAAALARRGEDTLPDDLFGPGALREWLDSPAPGQYGTTVGRWALAYWESESGIQQHFPRLDLDDAANYQPWLNHFEPAVALREEAGLGAVPEPRVPPASARRETGGWNIVGYVASEHGVGEAGRRVITGMAATGLPFEVVGLHAGDIRDAHPSTHHVAERLRFRDSIYCVNADMLPAALARLEHYHRVRADARRIGLWFWELATMPATLAGSLDHLEQVWVTSEFTAEAVRSLGGDVPVHVVTLPVQVPFGPTPFTRRHLGLPEGFLVAGVFDHHSVMARKNPLDLISAFRLAFPTPGEACLVLKSTNGQHHPDDSDRLRRAAEDRPDVLLVDATWSAAEVRALLELADCYASLHRSEGFGLNIADAMVLGTPVVTTAYSGNMRFCTPETVHLVPYDLVPVGTGNDPYPPAAEWAQPHVDAAAALLRRVFERPDEAIAMAARARAHVLTELSVERSRAEIECLLHGADAPPGAVVFGGR